MIPKSSSLRPLRLVSLNTYLIASAFNKNRETDVERRATDIRNDLLLQQQQQQQQQPIDLCFFQEVWGSGFQELLMDPVRFQYSMPPYRQPFRILFSYWPFTIFAEMGHTLYLHLNKTGGLFDLASSSSSSPSPSTSSLCNSEDTSNDETLRCIYRAKHTFTKSRSKSLKGVEATLWKIPRSIWNNNESRHDDDDSCRQYSLLVFNTHLDPWHPENRQHQIQEILLFMEQTFEAIHQQQQQQQQQQQKGLAVGEKNNWSTRTGVLVLGDFNIKANSDEYHNILLNNDGWEDFFSDCQYSETETYSRKNSLTTCPDDYGRIDYIFGITYFRKMNHKSGGYYRFLPLKCQHQEILEQPPGQELSDHYALKVELLPLLS